MKKKQFATWDGNITVEDNLEEGVIIKKSAEILNLNKDEWYSLIKCLKRLDEI